MAPAGDVDGDGLPDLLVGGRGEADGEGHGVVWLVTGAPQGDVALEDFPTLVGESDELGAALTAAGDITASFVDDLAMGAPGFGDGAGAVLIVAGPPVDAFTGDIEPPSAYLVGEPGQGFGRSVAGPLDTDGDGRVELLVGAPDGEAGAVYLFEGPITGSWAVSRADAILEGLEEGEEAGASVDHAGDLDGDGRGDLVVGAPGASAAYLWLGPASGAASLADADVRLVLADGELGAAVAGVGDVDGDGHDDVLIGAPEARAGQAWLVSGDGAVLAALLGIEDGDGAGAAVAGAGDVDGDGRPDLLVGAPEAGDGGAAWLVLGPVSGTLSLEDADGAFLSAGDASFGYAVAGPGDLDGDGFADLLIGAPAHESDGGDVGSVYVFLGGDCAEIEDPDTDDDDTDDADDTDDGTSEDTGDTDEIDLRAGAGCSCEPRGTGGTFGALLFLPLLLLRRLRDVRARC